MDSLRMISPPLIRFSCEFIPAQNRLSSKLTTTLRALDHNHFEPNSIHHFLSRSIAAAALVFLGSKALLIAQK
jgi:hypothetical protein